MKDKLLLIIGFMLIATVAATPAQARNHGSTTTYARVTGIEPVYYYVTIRKPQRHCSYRKPHRSHKRKHGRFVSGESYGSQKSRHRNKNNTSKFRRTERRHRSGHNQRVKHCTTTTVSHRERRFDGYHVTYFYQGDTYHTRTDYHPGDQIKISITVKPH